MVHAFVRYLDPAGRAGRADMLAFAAPAIVLAGLGTLAGHGLAMLAALAWPGGAVAARRLHDGGRSGWWAALALVPVPGWPLLAWWLARPGMRGANVHGVDPRGAARRAAGPVATGGWPVFH